MSQVINGGKRKVNLQNVFADDETNSLFLWLLKAGLLLSSLLQLLLLQPENAIQ